MYSRRLDLHEARYLGTPSFMLLPTAYCVEEHGLIIGLSRHFEYQEAEPGILGLSPERSNESLDSFCPVPARWTIHALTNFDTA